MFIEYALESEALILGERIKGGIFRPTAKCLRYSTISGALRSYLGSENVHAVGVIDEYKVEYFTYSPQDKVTRKSKIPIIAEVLTNVKARVYIIENEITSKLPKEFNLFLGGLRTKGFGLCNLSFVRRISKEDAKSSIRLGYLATRIPEKVLNLFMITNVMKPVYGYLFEPTSDSSGVYVRSLFEGSLVYAPKFLLKGV